MTELWYSDEKIGDTQYVQAFPESGDLIQWEYDGEPRDFIVESARTYFPMSKAPFTRVYLKAWGGWDFTLGVL